MTPATLTIGILTGAIGVGYFMYGKRQTKFVPLIAGMALCVYPYFVDSVLWLVRHRRSTAGGALRHRLLIAGVARTRGEAGARIFVPAAPPCIATDQFVAKQYR